MTIIAIAVLIALLIVVIVKNDKAAIKDFSKEYVEFVKAIFTAKCLAEFTSDARHVGATLVKAGKQQFRVLKLLGFWVALPFLVLAIPLIAVFVFSYRAFTK